MSPTEVPPELRRLIDARLDVIDRILAAAEMAWSERQSIVGEVETQIFELLAHRGQNPTQSDVIEVLDSLDPPESYVPDGTGAVAADSPPPVASVDPRWKKRVLELAAKSGSTVAWVTGLVVLNGTAVMAIAVSEGAIQWIVTLGCLAWLNYATVRFLREWSAEHRGNLLDDARKSLAAWLLPKDRAPAS